MKKILLLGSNGQLGTDLQRVLQRTKDVLPVQRGLLDMERFDQIYPFLSENDDFDVLINCTSYHRTDECEDFPSKSFAVNSTAAVELAKFCRKYDKLLIHFSTDYVFDGKNESDYSEDDAALPLNIYGISKLAGEYGIRAYHDKHFILRVSSLFGVAGASGKGGNFVETMLRLAKEEKPVKVVNDQFMSPTHTLDIARAVESLIDLNVAEYGLYHCSIEGECSWYEFAKEIFEQAGLSVNVFPVKSVEYKTKALRPTRSILNNSKINKYYFMPDWKDALRRYLKIKGYLVNGGRTWWRY